MPETFQCPKCGGPVSCEKNVVGANLTAKCPYCNSALSVPNAMRGPAQINIQIGSPTPSGKGAKWIVILILVPVVLIVVVAAAVGILIPLVTSSRRASVITVPNRPGGGTDLNPNKDQPPSFGKVLLNFGTEGIGPGMFKDARSIAVDGSGKIYVGEYSGGRIQVFDPAGKFLTQWIADPKMPLRGLAADRKGTVFVVQRGKISTYEGASGKPLGELPYNDGWGFDDVVVTADGGLVTAWDRASDDIIRFNADKEPVRAIRKAISSVTDRSELNIRVAADGLGNIYALGTFNNAVFKFSPDGKFQTRFGDDGDQPGQFRAPGAIAVDGKGRVYVSDIKGVQVFDTNGRYLRSFKPDGITSGMLFNDNGELFIAARTKVLKYSLNE